MFVSVVLNICFECSKETSYLWFVFVLSVYCSLVVTSWERADLLALLYVMFDCVLSLSMWCPGSDVVLDYIDS